MTTRKIVCREKKTEPIDIVKKLLFSDKCVCDECKVKRDDLITEQIPKKMPKKPKLNFKKDCYYCDNNNK